MKNKAVLYLRVSTSEQVIHGVSLMAQEERLLAYCTLQQLEVVQTYREEGVSGSKPLNARPQGARLLSMLRSRKAQHVVAMKLDRLFRNAEDALHQTSAWDSAGITLHLVDMGGQSLSTSSAIGRMMLTMMAAFAEFERNLISERTVTALAHKRSRRQVYNHTPYGYRREGGDILKIPEEQRIIRMIERWRGQGETFQAIADRLNSENIPTKLGTHWYPATIRKILGNDLHKVNP